MCEYCGCRRIPEIAQLAREHEVITELADEADDSRANREALHEALRSLRSVLAPHAEREERGVFTEARRSGMTGYFIEDLEDDHRRFVEMLDDLDSLDEAALETLLKDLDRHIALEEYEVFPVTAREFSPEQWDSIEQERDPGDHENEVATPGQERIDEGSLTSR